MSRGGERPIPSASENWREIAKKACKEEDAEKLAELVRRLCDALEKERNIKWRDGHEAPRSKA